MPFPRWFDGTASAARTDSSLRHGLLSVTAGVPASPSTCRQARLARGQVLFSVHAYVAFRGCWSGTWAEEDDHAKRVNLMPHASLLASAIVLVARGLAGYAGKVLAMPGTGFSGTTLAIATFGDIFTHLEPLRVLEAIALNEGDR